MEPLVAVGEKGEPQQHRVEQHAATSPRRKTLLTVGEYDRGARAGSPSRSIQNQKNTRGDIMSDTKDGTSRRRFLKTLGAAGATAVAGSACTPQGQAPATG